MFGMIRVTVPADVPPLPNAGTARAPVSNTSDAVIVVSVENRYRVVEAAALALPEFRVVSVTEKLPPATALAGGLLTAVTTRSGADA